VGIQAGDACIAEEASAFVSLKAALALDDEQERGLTLVFLDTSEQPSTWLRSGA
jgi:hypothetical protein